MEIMTIKTTELANKGLIKGLNKLNKLVGNMRKGQKDFSLELGRIVYNELYIDDFANLDGFCEFLGLSKSTLSQAKKYYELRELYRQDDEIHNRNNTELFDSFSFSQIVETFRIYNFFGFVEYDCFLQEISTEMTAKEIRDFAKNRIEEVENELIEFADEEIKEVTDEEIEDEVEVVENTIDTVIESALNCVAIMINERFNGDKKKALDYLSDNL